MAQITYGSITVSDLTDGKNANIWTTTVAPTTPDYTFNISNLTGSNDTPREGDIILYGVYRYTISSIGSTTVLAGNRQSLQGAAGTNGGKWYSGTGITGTSTTATIFNNSGVANAVVGDMYLNTSTNNTYRCTIAGAPSVAKWVYVNNIKGGQGVSVTKVETEYYRKLAGGQAPQSSTEGSTTIPEYVDGCTYYTRTVTYLSSGGPDKGQWLENTTLTTQIKNAYDAWIAAGAAEIKLKQFFPDTYGLIVTGEADAEVDQPSTYGYNTIMAPNYLGLRYNAINLAKLTTTESTPELQFYFPSFNSSTNTPVQGDKGLTLGTSGMNFYHTGSNTADATLNSNGLTISNGSIILGTTSGTVAGNVTLSNQNFNRSINGTPHDDLRFAIGSKFGVADDGTLYSSGLDSVASRVDGIESWEIGGRNLVWDTEWKNVSSRWTDWGSPTTREIVTIDGKRWLHIVTTTTKYQGYSQGQEKRNGYGEIKAGDKVVVSLFAYAAAANQKAHIRIHWRDSSGTIVSQNWETWSLTTTAQRYTSQTFTVPDGATGFNIMIGDGTNTAQELWISEVKMEFGNKATDWTPAPEDLENYADSAVNTFASKFTVTPENICSEVTATQDGKTLSTRINQDANTVKIKASKLAITGTTIFNLVDEDANAKAAMLNSELEIGSRNLLLSTGTANTWTISLNSSNYQAHDCYKTCSPVPSLFAVDDLVTISFDWSTTATGGNFRLECGTVTPYTWGTIVNAIGTRLATSYTVDITSSKQSGHVAITYKITSAQTSAATTLQWFRIRVDGADMASKTFTISNAKAERGNKATDWTPAPEDVDGAIATVNNKATAYRGTLNARTDGAITVNSTGFVLATGATISVYFGSSSNYAGKLTMNVNGTGAKDVWVGDLVTSDTNRLLWHYGSTITFTYDGTRWRVVDAPGTFYGDTCSTAAGTAAKVTHIPSGVIFRGCTIEAPMSNVNTSTSAALYIGNTADDATALTGNILYGTGSTVPTQSNGYSWLPGMSVIFKYDGKYWRTGNQTIIDGGHILTGTISADRIGANSITANKIAIGDFNNYITVNENNADTLLSGTEIVNGWLHKTSATTSNVWLAPVLPRWVKSGEKYRVTGTVKAPSAGSATVVIYGRTDSGSSSGSNSLTTVINANTETAINGIITISNTSLIAAPQTNIAIIFCTDSTWTTNYQEGYFKNLKCERMYGGELIVNGSITANHLAANSITVGDMNQDAKDKVLNSNIKVGGKNLLRNTANVGASGSYWPVGGWYSSGGGGTITTNVSINDSPIGLATATRLTSTDATKEIGAAQGGVPFVGGETITLSAWVKGTAGDQLKFQPVWANGSGTVPESGSEYFTIAASDNNKWVKYSCTKPVNYNHPIGNDTSRETNTYANAGYVLLYHAEAGHTALVTGVKLEYGNKATDWTEAPEDGINDNLLIDTQKMSAWYKGSGASGPTTDEFGVLTLTGDSSTWNSNFYSRPTIRTSILDGTPLWLSFEYKASAAITAMNVYLAGTSANEGAASSISRTKYSNNKLGALPVQSSWRRVIVPMPTVLSELVNGSGNVNSLFVQFYNRTANTTLQIRKVKLERGAFVTDWTPSPEEQKTYITRIDGAGIRIHPSSTENDSVVINDSGLEIFKGGTAPANSRAQFFDTIRLGASSGQRVSISSTDIDMFSSDGTKRVVVNAASGVCLGNLQKGHSIINDQGMTIYDVNNTDVAFFGNSMRIGVSTGKHVSINTDGMTIYTGNESDTTNTNVAFFGDTTRIGNGYKTHVYIEPAGSDVGIKFRTNYTTTGNVASMFNIGDIGLDTTAGWTSNPSADGGTFPKGAWFTFGYRNLSSVKGYYSFVSGFNNTAAQNASVAFGVGNNVYGPCAMSIGINNTVGTASSTSISDYAGNSATGNCSLAVGYQLNVRGKNQLVVGYNNDVDTNAAFIVGETGNKFVVKKTGEVFVRGSSVHSSDRRLKEHIDYLSNDNTAVEFIKKLKPAHYIKDNKPHVGFYAQDVKEIDSWGCLTGEEYGYMTLSYMEIIAPLVTYCQHLEKRIEQLEGR